MPSKNTKIISARVPNEIEFKVPVSKVLTSVYHKIKAGEIDLTDDGVEVKCLSQEPMGIPDCTGCEYLENSLDMSKFNEVCEYKGLDRQKAIDRCAQMLWR